MFKPIPGNNLFMISLAGQFCNIDGTECTPSIKDEKVEIELFGVKKFLDVLWLALYAHYEVNFPENLRNKIWSISFVEANTRVIKSDINKAMVFYKPIVLKNKYRVIPGFTDYAVSKNGEVILTKTFKIIKSYSGGKNIYPKASVYNPDKRVFRNMPVHRLVAIAWVYNKDWLVYDVVNHIDGDRRNFKSDNLEWVSSSENAIHAFKNGLRKDNTPCKLFDIVTREIKNYYSISSAAKDIGLSYSYLLTALRYKCKTRLICGRYEIKLDTDDTEWFYQDKERPLKNGRYVVTVEYPNGNKEIFNDLRDIKSKLSVWNVSNVWLLVDKIKQKYPDYRVTVEDTFLSSPSQAYNVKTGEIVSARTIMELASIIGMSRAYISKIINYKDERFVYKGYAFRSYSEKEWNTDFTDPIKSSVCILAFNTVTQEELIFNSLREIARFFKKDRCVFQRCLKNKELLSEWSFKEIVS